MVVHDGRRHLRQRQLWSVQWHRQHRIIAPLWIIGIWPPAANRRNGLRESVAGLQLLISSACASPAATAAILVRSPATADSSEWYYTSHASRRRGWRWGRNSASRQGRWKTVKVFLKLTFFFLRTLSSLGVSAH